MTTMDKIEARAAAKAIYATVRILEGEFGVRARGSTPQAQRSSVIQQLHKKFEKPRKRTRHPVRGPIVSDFVLKIEKAAASQQGLRLDDMTVQRLARVIPHGAFGVARNLRSR